MDGHEHPGLSDEALEKEIEAALDVDPSPEFLVRVRTRVATERIDGGWAWLSGWRLTGVTVAAAAVVVIGLWSAREPASAPPETPLAGAPPVVPRSRTPKPQSAPAAITSSNVSKPVIPARPDPVAQPPLAQAELLISQDEAAALRQLFTAISNGRFDAAVLPDLDAALQPPSEIREIVLEPITLSPLASLESE
jgi:hypothetical protein